MDLKGIEKYFVKSWSGWDEPDSFALQLYDIVPTEYTKKFLGPNWADYDTCCISINNCTVEFFSKDQKLPVKTFTLKASLEVLNEL